MPNIVWWKIEQDKIKEKEECWEHSREDKDSQKNTQKNIW